MPDGEGALPRLLVIVGPTASGKSSLAIEIARAVDGEIVSADSMQVYRGLDIGTGKVTPEEMQGVPHHLLDVLEPEVPFSVAQYQALAGRAIASIAGRGRLPILVGGTGLYVRAVVEDFLFPDPGADPEFRQRLQDEADAKGPQTLHERLVTVDPVAAGRIHPHDVRRIIRALEVHALTGQPISVLQRQAGRKRRYDALMLGLTAERPCLYQRIESRVDEMLSRGLVREVRGLVQRGLAGWLTSVQALGYKEFLPYLRGEHTLEECVETLKRETRRYAKRQLTWFRREEGVNWLRLEGYPSFGTLRDAALRLVEGRWPGLAK